MPSREEMIKRADRLPEPLRSAALKALRTSNTRGGKARLPGAPPSTSPPAPGAPLEGWPGYLWYLEQLDEAGARQMAVGCRYWRMSPEEKATLKRRAGWTHQQVVEARNAAAARRASTPSGRTARPGPEGTRRYS
jgi:hypothetical protein